ncbi:hypothetical protein D477_016290 [Arthrobacter crystallopoietes BAB-32]|uniref:Activator of Hsp90 ATPase 1 family protein n=1 Tax=Arthrobacter crystallopoietes BAB-32 TaxID=1246476 RepID=N1URY2_9MICC|nr:SRPBCC domain-containing protein [Arthrobacter crystallopoietes]EMY33176.1 hypothetical protein D477_016290 [Arthrobacter crystallopoietes BAB-32]
MTESNHNPLSVHINADARQVWVMLREPSLIAQWHGWELDSLEDEINLIYFTDATESEDHLKLVANGGNTFTLEPVGDGTRVTLERGPVDPESEMADWDQDITEGFTSFLQQLRFALERHPNTPRQTTYFSHDAVPEGGALASLGLDNLPAPGEEYEAELSTGETISGKVWFRTDNQLGLTVRSYAEHGDGLLIVADMPRHERLRPDGGTQVLITTYGLGARRLGEIRSAWDSWRTQHFPSSEELTVGRPL